MLLRLKAPAENASGKQGQEIVYFMWRQGQTARNYVIPSQPQTSNQVKSRAFLSTITKRWSTLSASNRNSWQNYASNNPITNRMGQPVKSTALGMYLRLNFWTQVRTTGATFVDTAPTTSAPSGFTAVTLFEKQSANEFTFVGTHGHSTLTNLFVVARMKTSKSLATNPASASIPIISGITADSFKALQASGNATNFESTRYDPLTGQFADITAYILNQFGQLSTGNKVKLEVI